MPPLLVRGVKEALAEMRGPIILIANLLTEGRGMAGFTAADARALGVATRSAGRSTSSSPTPAGRRPRRCTRYAAEHKRPLELGDLEPGTEAVLGRFWCTEIARHDRRRLSFAVWTVLSQRLLSIRARTALTSEPVA